MVHTPAVHFPGHGHHGQPSTLENGFSQEMEGGKDPKELEGKFQTVKTVFHKEQ